MQSALKGLSRLLHDLHRVLLREVHLQMLHLLSRRDLTRHGLPGQSRVLRALPTEPLSKRTTLPNQLVFDRRQVLLLRHKTGLALDL